MGAVDPEQLLDQADRLIRRGRGGAPQDIDLRRAVSNAYYAIFHEIARDTADDLIGRKNRDTPQYALTYRNIEHRALKSLCETALKSRLPDRFVRYVPSGSFGAPIKSVAAAIIDLQEKRYLADYDPHFATSTSEVELTVATSRTALLQFRKAPRRQRREFVSFLFFSPR